MPQSRRFMLLKDRTYGMYPVEEIFLRQTGRQTDTCTHTHLLHNIGGLQKLFIELHDGHRVIIHCLHMVLEHQPVFRILQLLFELVLQ